VPAIPRPLPLGAAGSVAEGPPERSTLASDPPPVDLVR
jgi:hypothetical protein